MSRILIVYGTTEGHTRKIAGFVSEVLGDHGFETELVDSLNPPASLDVGSAAGFIVAGSLHQGSHQHSLADFVRDHLSAIQRGPSLFLSVSLTAVIKDEEHVAAAQKCIGKFIEDTGWMPTVSKPVAGAMKYTEYDFLKRMVIKMIARAEGGDTDTSRDYEYTDWEELRGTVEAFLAEHMSVSSAK